MKKEIKKIIDIPENVQVDINVSRFKVKGPLGEVSRNFILKNIIVENSDKKITFKVEKATKNDKKLMNTFVGHVINMITGVTRGYEYQLQICSTHFPITTSVDKQKKLFVIKNFLGENKDRVTKLMPNAEISINGDIVTIKSIDKETAGQQAANIENVTRISSRDKRVFQDGIWIIKKQKGKHYLIE
jgi:large subunit ribosomal protein L6